MSGGGQRGRNGDICNNVHIKLILKNLINLKKKTCFYTLISLCSTILIYRVGQKQVYSWEYTKHKVYSCVIYYCIFSIPQTVNLRLPYPVLCHKLCPVPASSHVYRPILYHLIPDRRALRTSARPPCFEMALRLGHGHVLLFCNHLMNSALLISSLFRGLLEEVGS